MERTKGLPKLICKIKNSHLPTAFPVYYYGSSDKRIYVVWSRLYETKGGATRVEFVFSVLTEFSYDYEKGKYSNQYGLTSMLEDFAFNGHEKMTNIRVVKDVEANFDKTRAVESQLMEAIKKYHRKLELSEQKRIEAELKSNIEIVPIKQTKPPKGKIK